MESVESNHIKPDWFSLCYDFLKRDDIEGERLTAYPDPATKGEPWTIGVGHTGFVDGVRVARGMTITFAKSRQLLREDISNTERHVRTLVRVPITNHQKAALVSLVFNIGVGNFQASTLLRKLNAGDTGGAADQFLVWDKARVNGKLTQMAGLVERRALEREMFLTDD